MRRSVPSEKSDSFCLDGVARQFLYPAIRCGLPAGSVSMASDSKPGTAAWSASCMRLSQALRVIMGVLFIWVMKSLP